MTNYEKIMQEMTPEKLAWLTTYYDEYSDEYVNSITRHCGDYAGFVERDVIKYLREEVNDE